jgi:DNA gyrase/topoisomerase IV subunit B
MSRSIEDRLPKSIIVKDISSIYRSNLMPELSQYPDDEIKVYTLMEAVRLRPKLHLKDIQIPDELILATLCHAIDEVLDGKCNWIKIEIDREIVNIEYDTGMSLYKTPSGRTAADLMMTVLYACHNMKKHLEVGAKYCQTGLAIVNAYCDRFEIETISHDKIGTQVYIQGESDRDFSITNCHDADRTRFRFMLDRDLVGDYQFDLGRLQSQVLELARELNIKITIES